MKKTVKTSPALHQKPPQVAASPGPAAMLQSEFGSVALDHEWPGPEHRQFPRARIAVPFALSIGEGDDLKFSATLSSWNLSVSGAFLESTYFLPVGTEVHASFQLGQTDAPVQTRAEIIRQERPDPKTGAGRSGIAIRFHEFFGQTEVTLAKLFLGEKLRLFVEKYLQSKRAMSLRSEFERVVDALAAWELTKVTSAEDIWRPREEQAPEKSR